MKHIILGAVAAAALVGVAGAQTRSAADTIHMRQANYKQMGAAMRGINDELRGSAPQIEIIRRNAAVFATHAPQVLNWFPAGSGPQSGVTTRARPEIWTDRAGFTRAGAQLLVASRSLSAAAQSGDLAAIRAAMPALGRSCGGCHELFRVPEN